MQREFALKRLTRAQKRTLINQFESVKKKGKT